MAGEIEETNDIRINQFREILIWPLRIETHQTPQTEPNDSDKSFSKFVEYIGSSDSWTEIPLTDRGTAKSQVTRYAEFVYFHPFVQRFLYNSGRNARSAIHIFQRNNVRKVEIKLPHYLSASLPSLDIYLDVDRIHLYLFDMGVAFLVVEISYDADDPNSQPLYLKQVQEILDRFRRVYPPYWERNDPGHCPDETTWILDDDTQHKSNYHDHELFIDFYEEKLTLPVSDHWEFLLKPMVPFRTTNPKTRYCYRQIEDERIPFMAYIAVENPRLIQPADFVRLAFADGSGDSTAFPYAPGFLCDFEQRYCYDRYWYEPSGKEDDEKYNWMTTRYLCTDYTFLMIGKDEPTFFTETEVGALAHFRHHYFQMGLIVHFHKAALLMLSDRLSRAVTDFSEDGDHQALNKFHETVEEILRDLLRFTERYWFHEISNQLQAKELFDLWSRHLGTRELFELVRQEAQDINNYLDVAEQQKQTHAATRLSDTTLRLTVVAALGLVFALTSGFMGMNIITQKHDEWFWIFLAMFLALTLIVVLYSGRLAKFIEDLSDTRFSALERVKNAFGLSVRK